MRLFLALACLAALAALAPAAAAQCPPACIGAGFNVTYPSDACGDCAGVAVHAGTLQPYGCSDCDAVGAAAGVGHDGSGTAVSVQACRSGATYVCPVDETLTV
jgi:hypothetical protein